MKNLAKTSSIFEVFSVLYAEFNRDKEILKNVCKILKFLIIKYIFP